MFIEGTTSPVDLDAKVAALIEGKDPSMAYRAILTDSKTKRETAIKEAVKTEQPIAGMEVVDGVYKKVTEAASKAEETKEETKEEPTEQEA